MDILNLSIANWSVYRAFSRSQPPKSRQVPALDADPFRPFMISDFAPFGPESVIILTLSFSATL